MGKGKRQKQSSNADGEISVKKSTQRWDALPSTNVSFVEYYKNQQRIVSSDEEWDQLFNSFRTDLPTTFRITGGKKNAIQLNQIIQDTYVPFLSNIRINNEPIPPPQKISWYPDGMAWELRASKQLIRKSAEFKKFQNFLVYETEAGNLSRQEAVSMIPPLLLDVQSHHYVLDACAAPGSKTAQLVEALHSSSSGPIPTGLLIANDSDYKRSHLLVHQSLRRLPSPSTMITNHDASRFPSLSMKNEKLTFDRILCDVPCSGDGTLRKNGGIWRDWTPANGIGLHGLQLRILSRAISLLKPGGRLVYSTCSLNPLENEAVVSAALAQFPSMSLKDVSDCLPTLVRRPGLTSWTVTRRESDQIRPLATPDDAPDPKKYPRTLWPSGREAEFGLGRCLRIYPHLQDTGAFFVAVLEKRTSKPKESLDGASQSIAQTAEVEAKNPRCNSITEADEQKPNLDVTSKPADQPATGSTVDQTVDLPAKRLITADASELQPTEPERKRPKVECADGAVKSDPEVPGDTEMPSQSKQEPLEQVEEASTPAEREDSGRCFKEDPYVYLKPGNKDVEKCIEYFDIDPSFPVDDLLVRNAEGTPTRTIYLTSSVVREVIEHNGHARLRLICCGVKIFGRQDGPGASGAPAGGSEAKPSQPCKWRIVSDGVEFFRPFMGPKRLLTCDVAMLRQLMSAGEQYPRFADLADASFRAQVEKLEGGSCVAEVVGEGVPTGLMVGIWVSKASVNLMVDKKERKVLSLRLWGEDVTSGSSNKLIKTHVANGKKQEELGKENDEAEIAGEAVSEVLQTEAVEETNEKNLETGIVKEVENGSGLQIEADSEGLTDVGKSTEKVLSP